MVSVDLVGGWRCGLEQEIQEVLVHHEFCSTCTNYTADRPISSQSLPRGATIVQFLQISVNSAHSTRPAQHPQWAPGQRLSATPGRAEPCRTRARRHPAGTCPNLQNFSALHLHQLDPTILLASLGRRVRRDRLARTVALRRQTRRINV